MRLKLGAWLREYPDIDESLNRFSVLERSAHGESGQQIVYDGPSRGHRLQLLLKMADPAPGITKRMHFFNQDDMELVVGDVVVPGNGKIERKA